MPRNDSLAAPDVSKQKICLTIPEETGLNHVSQALQKTGRPQKILVIPNVLQENMTQPIRIISSHISPPATGHHTLALFVAFHVKVILEFPLYKVIMTVRMDQGFESWPAPVIAATSLPALVVQGVAAVMGF
jgi:hypothetical protein